jgi:glutamate formiminotransferase/formiminotetrahydrofolate cyclodeaminase
MMSNKVVECVPNFSEARDLSKIKQITDTIESVAGVTLLSVEPGPDMNRTVVTFVGSPEAVSEGAFQAIKKASEVLDMRTHQGSHPRMGATDVCPFVPVEGVSMDDCAEIARTVGKRVGDELSIPIYLYENAASTPERQNLATVRKGEYEGLEAKLKDPKWKPDFGPAEFNAKAGATAISAREFLIAYNVTLNTTEKKYANDIAFELREKGRVARSGNIKPFYNKGSLVKYKQDHFPCGSCEFVGKSFDEIKQHCQSEHGYDLEALIKMNGKNPANPIGLGVFKPGKFTHCKAIGWFVEEFHRAQISINLTNYNITSMHHVLEETRKLAAERGLVVTGSEIVGLVPYQALLQAGQFYLEKQGRSAGVPVDDILNTAVFSLGLDDVTPFDIKEKVLGLPTTHKGNLVTMTVGGFTDEVSRDTPAPGGGSIGALSGALGAALASMVATLTHGKKGTEEIDAALDRLAQNAQTIKNKLVAAVDEDTDAFNAYMEASRLPQSTNEEKAHRKNKMLEGMKIAIEVPWRTTSNSFEAMKVASEVARIGNPNSITDAGVGVAMGFSGVQAGIWNVLINLKDIDDAGYIAEMRAKCKQLLQDAHALTSESHTFVDGKLNEMIEASLK